MARVAATGRVINGCGYGTQLLLAVEMSGAVIRDLWPADELAAERLLDAELGRRHQARLGEMNDVLALPGLGGWENDRLIGLATYALAATGPSSR